MKTVLHIGLGGLEYWRKSRGGWQAVAGAAQGAIWVVTDLAEESLIDIAVPRLFGRDRAHFVARQLVNRFPDTPFRSATPLPAGASLMERLAPARQLLSGVDAAQRIQSALDAQSAALVGVWSSSQLLARLGQDRSLPSELFVVLPGSRSLRIVFLKNRQPVLARLAPVGAPPAEQAAEIVRTLRHLENSRILEHSLRRYPVLVLGAAAGLEAALAAQGMDLISAPKFGPRATPPDWRFALFDLVVTSPRGQLAPRGARSAFLAQRLARAAYGGAALCLSATLWFVGAQLHATEDAQHERDRLQYRFGQLQRELGETEARIGRFDVTPALLRQVVSLNASELVDTPTLADGMRLVADLVGREDGRYVSRFQWQRLSSAQPACAQVDHGGGTKLTGLSAVHDGGSPVELSFDLELAEGSSNRSRARTLAGISTSLAQVRGVTLLQDPARSLDHGALSNSTDDDTPQGASWCLRLAGPAGASP